jgi:hypothetical protein
MGDLNEARLLAVRTLLQRAPDFAVQSLSSLLATDRSDDNSIRRVRELVSAEARDRRFRSAAFEPLAALWSPRSAIPCLSFPSKTPSLLWQAVKDYEPSLRDEIATAAEPSSGRRETLALLDDICAAAADGLAQRATPAFAALADLLDARPKGCSRLATLLTMAPDLRESIARAPIWLGGVDPDHAAALRIAFRSASEKGPEAGFLYMELLFASIEQPAFILRLVSMIMDRPSDRFLAASELRTIGERLLDAIDRHVGAIKDFDPARGLEGGVAAAAASDAATLIITEFETHLAMSREGVWGARIVQQRQALTLAMEMRLREVEAATSAALPLRTVRVNGKFLRGPPSLSEPPDRAAVDKVMALTALLSGCRTAALVTGFGALRTKVLETQDKALDSYIQDVLDMLHRRQAPAEIARAYLDVAAELFGLVREPKAAELVRRRTVAALSTAA